MTSIRIKKRARGDAQEGKVIERGAGKTRLELPRRSLVSGRMDDLAKRYPLLATGTGMAGTKGYTVVCRIEALTTAPRYC